VVTPAYLLGAIPLGVLMQTASAFQRVENSVAFIINYYGKIAEWKAAMDRVWQMDAALRSVDRADLDHAAIVVEREARPDVAMHGVVLRREDGKAIVTVPDLTLAAGDRLLVNGASGSGKSTLFRALSGNWPFGEGRIRVPQGARLLTLPARPYFPLGTLRQAVALPTPAEEIADQDIRSAMAAVGLAHLIPRLDEIAEWDTALSAGEQHRVGFARALIHRPDILLLDDADAMVEGGRARELYRLLIERLPDTIIISASRSEALSDLHGRTIELCPAGLEARVQGAMSAAV
jgi:putative ATP-binding cassette transporter